MFEIKVNSEMSYLLEFANDLLPNRTSDLDILIKSGAAVGLVDGSVSQSSGSLSLICCKLQETFNSCELGIF